MEASKMKRLIACVIDWYLSSALASIPVLFLNLGVGMEWETAMLSGSLAVVVCSIYYLWIPLAWRGQTPGKKIMKIGIVCMDGSAVSFRTLFAREIIGVLLIEGSIVVSSGYLREMMQLCMHRSILVPLSVGSGIITIISAGMAVWRSDGRMIHDWIGKTVVRAL